MARMIEPGAFKTRRDGTIVRREGQSDYEITRPGFNSWARFYPNDVGGWCVDIHQDDLPWARAFVATRAEAEDVGALSLLSKPTGRVWYDLKAVIVDQREKVEVTA